MFLWLPHVLLVWLHGCPNGVKMLVVFVLLQIEKLTYLVSLLPTDRARSAGVYCHFGYRVNRQKCANFLEWLVTVGVLQTSSQCWLNQNPKTVITRERSLEIDSTNKTFFPFLLFALFCLINGSKHKGFFLRDCVKQYT